MEGEEKGRLVRREGKERWRGEERGVDEKMVIRKGERGTYEEVGGEGGLGGKRQKGRKERKEMEANERRGERRKRKYKKGGGG